MAEKNIETKKNKTEKRDAKKRIYQIAKELNLSHEEIISFLKENEISVSSHMSPVDETTYNKILAEFAKEKVIVEREKSESIQREQESLRILEKEIEKKRIETASIMPHEVPVLEKTKSKEKVDPKSKEDPTDLKAVDSQPTDAKEKTEKVAIVKPDLPAESTDSEKSKEKTDQSTDQETSVSEIEPISDVKQKRRKIDLDKLPSDKKRSKELKPKRKRVRIKKAGQDTAETIPAEAFKRRKKALPVDQKAVDESIKKTLAAVDASSKKKKRRKTSTSEEVEIDSSLLKVAEYTSVGDLASLMDIPTNELIAKCMELGFMVTINHRLDFDTIVLLSAEYEFKVERVEEFGSEVVDEVDIEEKPEDLKERAPVVTIMGHVDHGKTSLLDFIRNESVVAGEAGGITQHIGAYRVILDNGKEITFLDTPGHEAFTAMRARGAQVTDIVVIVIAADDGVKPQTIEAINHARAAKVPIIVAINKIDKPNADIENVKRELSEYKIVVESWGGKTQSVEVSAKTGEGIEDLLLGILLESELLELKANPNRRARGIVVESRLDKGLGPLGTILIQKGTLKIGDVFICGTTSGKVRILMDERGNRVKETAPSIPVQVLGFDAVPAANDFFAVLEEEREVKKISFERQRIKREQQFRKIKLRTLDEISQQIKEGKVRELSIIIKGDTDGSVEALNDLLVNLSTKEVAVKVIHSAVGTIVESDILLATASGAVIIGFHIEATAKAKQLAEKESIDIRIYNVIYDVENEIKTALEGMLEPEKLTNVIGSVEIRAVFSNSKVGAIAGCYVLSGKVSRGDMINLLRDEQMVSQGTISSLKRFKDDVKEVAEGFECGITLEGVNGIEEGDIIQIYEITDRKRTLDEARV
ncbi:MAG: translation initiation factor IF-2 [Candidatus Marinimicrobia bacterium]|nr:translation initiation factor IF-2 [Candidatus Neomarinimicrobiota bacterium]